MSGADAVADSDAAEFNGSATGAIYSVFYLLRELAQVFVAGDDIGEGVTNADDGPTKIIITKAAGFIKGTTGYHFVVHEGALGKFLCHGRKYLSLYLFL